MDAVGRSGLDERMGHFVYQKLLTIERLRMT